MNPDEEESVPLTEVQLEPGELFQESFDQHEEVGKGRFGIVYRVTEKQSNKRRAAKLIKCIKRDDKEKVNLESCIIEYDFCDERTELMSLAIR